MTSEDEEQDLSLLPRVSRARWICLDGVVADISLKLCLGLGSS